MKKNRVSPSLEARKTGKKPKCFSAEEKRMKKHLHAYAVEPKSPHAVKHGAEILNPTTSVDEAPPDILDELRRILAGSGR